MTRALKRKLALGVAVIAVLSGGAVATVSATGQNTTSQPGSHHRAHAHGVARANGGVLATAVAYLGLPASRVRSDLKSGQTLAQISNATPGKSEAGLIAALTRARRQRLAEASSKVAQSVSVEVNRPLLGTAARKGVKRGARAAVRQYLDLPASLLRSDLRSGQTLAQIANATPGKSEAGLVEAIVAARSKRLDAAVSAGKLTKTRESEQLAKLVQRVKAAVNRVHPAGHRHAAKTKT